MENKKTILQRLETVETELSNLSDSVNAAFNNFKTTMQSEMEVVEAVVNVLNSKFPVAEGEPNFSVLVEQAMQAKKAARENEQLTREKDHINNLIKAGALKVTDALTTNSLLVGRIFTAADNTLVKARVQIEFSRLTPPAQQALLGKGVGDTFESDGQKLEIVEVYEVVQTATPTAAPVSTPARAEAAPEPTSTPDPTVA